MEPNTVCSRLCLDSVGTDGLTQEVSQVVALQDSNAVQLEVVVVALTGDSITAQLQFLRWHQLV